MSEIICETNGCTAPALMRVYWPGQVLDACMGHAMRSSDIAQAMGFNLAIHPIAKEDKEATSDG